jgi:hypothetical protein
MTADLDVNKYVGFLYLDTVDNLCLYKGGKSNLEYNEKLLQQCRAITSDVNVSFFCDRKQFVFCFRSRKNEC